MINNPKVGEEYILREDVDEGAQGSTEEVVTLTRITPTASSTFPSHGKELPGVRKGDRWVEVETADGEIKRVTLSQLSPLDEQNK